MKKIFTILLLNLFVCFPCFSKETKFLECKMLHRVVKNRLWLEHPDLTNEKHWTVDEERAFYFVVLGKDWDDIEEGCNVFTTYVEVETRHYDEPFRSEDECLDGPYGKGEYKVRDEWGGYFTKRVKNTYTDHGSCMVKNLGWYVNGPVVKQPWAQRRKCSDAWKHFLRSGKDRNYNERPEAKMWQKEECHEISQDVFEKGTGYKTKELLDVLTGEVL